MKSFRTGSLFAGIGGFDLGLERAGFEIAWQCELDPFRRSVLARHWPDTKRYEDITKLYDPEPVDVLCGGFPCTDVSDAGRKAGIAGANSGLWFEYCRVIRLLRPSYVIVENVSSLLWHGIEEVFTSLAAIGYDAEWDCLPATAFGAPHRRERLWLVAYPSSQLSLGQERLTEAGREVAQEGSGLPPDNRPRVFRSAQGGQLTATPRFNHENPWSTEPPVGRLALRVPNWVDRLRALGDSLVPYIAEWIGKRIIEYELQATKADICRDA